jgi:hypothetical protein
MHVMLNSRILTVLAFLTLASLGIRAAHDRASSLEREFAAESPETQHLGCYLGRQQSLCGLDADPAGDLVIVEPSFG